VHRYPPPVNGLDAVTTTDGTKKRLDWVQGTSFSHSILPGP
jgi:hypothetical protein